MTTTCSHEVNKLLADLELLKLIQKNRRETPTSTCHGITAVPVSSPYHYYATIVCPPPPPPGPTKEELEFKAFKQKCKEEEAKKALEEKAKKDLLLEKAKDLQFQDLFKTLWPNLAAKLVEKQTPPPPPAPCSNEITLRLCMSCPPPTAPAPAPPAPPAPAPTWCLTMPPAPAPAPPAPPAPAQTWCLTMPPTPAPAPPAPAPTWCYTMMVPAPPQPQSTQPKPNLVSSYNIGNYNFQSMAMQNCDMTALNALKADQEKLKQTVKLESATNLVDGLIKKAEYLQECMKQKSDCLKVESQMLALEKEKLRRSCADLAARPVSPCRSNTRLDCELYKDCMARLSRSRSRCDLEVVKSLDCDYSDHHSRHRSKHRSSSSRRSSCDKSKSPVSILKAPKATLIIRRRADQTTTTSDSSVERYRARSSSCRCRGKHAGAVGPRVDSWNCNCKKVDSNIY